METCNATGCSNEATSAVGLELRPTTTYMRFTKLDGPLMRLVFGLKVCSACLLKLKVEDLASDKQLLHNMCHTATMTTGIKCDPANTKVVAIAFDDPDYLVLLKQSESINDITPAADQGSEAAPHSGT